jgi:hypothetical protein
MIRYSLFSVIPIRPQLLTPVNRAIDGLTSRPSMVRDGRGWAFQNRIFRREAANKAATELLPSYWDGSDRCHDGNCAETVLQLSATDPPLSRRMMHANYPGQNCMASIRTTSIHRSICFVLRVDEAIGDGP